MSLFIGACLTIQKCDAQCFKGYLKLPDFTGAGIGTVFGNLVIGYARNPGLKQQLFTYAILGFALSEAMGLFCLMMAFLMLFAFQQHDFLNSIDKLIQIMVNSVHVQSRWSADQLILYNFHSLPVFFAQHLILIIIYSILRCTTVCCFCVCVHD